MMLLLDAGNSRIKWGVFHAGEWLASGALDNDALHREAPQQDTLRGLAMHAAGQTPIERIVGANVAGEAVASAIEHHVQGLATVEWLRPLTSCCGVYNLYDDPERLGVDRWAALIGARAMIGARACLVVTAGTATTVDVLDAEGRFEGGLILPGLHLMRKALLRDTAQLRETQGEFTTRPRNTADAITSGCLNAQAGAIERMYHSLPAGAACVISGGGASQLLPLLDCHTVQPVDNLVLKGLAVIAQAQPAARSASD